MGMGKLFDKVFDNILTFFGYLSFICILLTMIVMCAEVVMRYFFNKPLGWSIEVCTHLLVYICFLAAPYVLAKDRHVIMDIVYAKMPEAVKVRLDIVNSVLIVLISSIISWYSFRVTMDLYQSGIIVHGTTETPQYLIVGVIFLSGFLLLVESLRRTYRSFYVLFGNKTN